MFLQQRTATIGGVSTSALTYSQRRVIVWCSALLALLAVFEVVGGRSLPDGASYHAGYAAVSDPHSARTALAHHGASAAFLCEDLLERTVISYGSDSVVPRDFLTGCRRAVGDAME